MILCIRFIPLRAMLPFPPRSLVRVARGRHSAACSIRSNGSFFGEATGAAPSVRQADASRWSQSTRNTTPLRPRQYKADTRRPAVSSRGISLSNSMSRLRHAVRTTAGVVPVRYIPKDRLFPLLFCFSREVKQGFRQVAVPVGVLVQIILMVLVGRIKIAQRQFFYR